jgi:magnesium transporter
VTYHEESIRALERAWQSDLKDLRHHRLGADHLLYRLTDELISDFMNTVDEMDEEIEVTEDSVLRNPTPGVVEKIFTIKRATLHLRRSLSPLREVLNKLARDDFAVIDARDRIYFRDIYDHLVRLHDISEGLRDLSSGVLDTYLSVINNRMNEVMKTLTIITTIFMPISFLAGFFGMNFFVPEHPYPLSLWVTLPVYIPVLFIFVVTPIMMFLWFRKRGWM